MDFNQYLANHQKDVGAGSVMQLPEATLKRRFNGDWSGGLNASEMFRDQSNSSNPIPAGVGGGPVPQAMTSTIAAPNDTFNGVLDPSDANPAAVSGMAPNNPAASNMSSGGSWWNDGSQLSDYDSYIDRSFQHARRTLDPLIRKNEDRFNQSMIDKGFSSGGEGYQDEYDNNSRRYNDLINAAAFSAMNFGANRMDSDRNFALNELSTVDNMNRAWDQANYRNAVFNTGREDQRFNQMLSLFGMTPVGSVAQTNMGSAFANQGNAQMGALNAQNQLYGQAAQGITDAIGAVDWGGIFGNWGKGNTESSPIII